MLNVHSLLSCSFAFAAGLAYCSADLMLFNTILAEYVLRKNKGFSSCTHRWAPEVESALFFAVMHFHGPCSLYQLRHPLHMHMFTLQIITGTRL